MRRARRPRAARRGLMVSGLPGTGKTSAITQLGRAHELLDRARHPNVTDRIPVLYLTAPPAATARMVAAEFAHFLGLPVRSRSNMTDIIQAVVGVCTDTRTGLVLVDEIHNVSQVTRAGGEVSDTLKYFSERMPATFVYAGIGLETSELLAGPRGARIAGRFTLVPTRPFPYGDEWKGLVATLENTLLLHDHPPGSLVKLDRDPGGCHRRRPQRHRTRHEGSDRLDPPGPCRRVRGLSTKEGCWPMTEGQEQRLRRLPVQVRPRSGEPTDSYIRRLVLANHLKPSYLHGFLTGSPNWFGRPRLERLAILTGRPPELLQRVLADNSSPRRRRKPGPSSTPSKKIGKRELYQRLRHDAEAEGLSTRALARRHNVTWRTVRAALDGLELRARKPLPRRPTAIDPVQHLIDSMIETGHDPKDIWAKLMDEHETSISYAAIRLYVQNRTPLHPRHRASVLSHRSLSSLTEV